jgi:hypothetical protein
MPLVVPPFHNRKFEMSEEAVCQALVVAADDEMAKRMNRPTGIGVSRH